MKKFLFVLAMLFVAFSSASQIASAEVRVKEYSCTSGFGYYITGHGRVARETYVDDGFGGYYVCFQFCSGEVLEGCCDGWIGGKIGEVPAWASDWYMGPVELQSDGTYQYDIMSAGYLAATVTTHDLGLSSYSTVTTYPNPFQ